MGSMENNGYERNDNWNYGIICADEIILAGVVLGNLRNRLRRNEPCRPHGRGASVNNLPYRTVWHAV